MRDTNSLDFAAVATEIHDGDWTAFSTYYATYFPGVVRQLAATNGPAEACDAAQTAFLSAIETIHRANGNVKEIEKTLRGIFVIARTRGIDLWRKNKRARTSVLDPERNRLAEPRATPEQQVMLEELGAAVRCTLAVLPTECAALLVAKYEEQRSLHEIAQELKVPLGTVGSRLSKARRLFVREFDLRRLSPQTREHPQSRNQVTC